MSDEEKTPPALRLKPRLRPPDKAESEETPATPAAHSQAPQPEAAADSAAPSSEKPRIRLKPRLTKEEPSPTPAESAGETSTAATPEASAAQPAGEAPRRKEASAEPGSAASEKPRIRLKPRVSSETPASDPAKPAPDATADPAPSSAGSEPPAATAPETPAATAPKIKLKPRVGQDAAPAPSPQVSGGSRPPPAAVPAGGGKFKLKPKTAAPASPAPTPPSAPTAGAEKPAAEGQAGPPPFPVVAASREGGTAPPVPHVKVEGEVAEPEAPAKPATKRKHRWVLELGLFGFAGLLLVGGLYFGWKKFMAPPPAPPPVVAKPAPEAPPAPAAPPPPTAPAPEPAGGLANTVARTEESLADREAIVVADADAAIDAATRPAARPEPETTTATTEMTSLSPGVSASVEISVASEASPAFRAFVANIKVSGVFQGTPARALVDGRMVRQGEMVDPVIGVSFDSIDADKKLLIFKDRTGATVVRKY